MLDLLSLGLKLSCENKLYNQIYKRYYYLISVLHTKIHTPYKRWWLKIIWDTERERYDSLNKKLIFFTYTYIYKTKADWRA